MQCPEIALYLMTHIRLLEVSAVSGDCARQIKRQRLLATDSREGAGTGIEPSYTRTDMGYMVGYDGGLLWAPHQARQIITKRLVG